MDEQQLRKIIREVLQRVSEEENLCFNADSSPLPKAYFIFPQNWMTCDSGDYLQLLKEAGGQYQRIVALPERGEGEQMFSDLGCTVVGYNDLCTPAEGSVTVFPIPCRDLVIKTALCLSMDFETAWIRKCIENGLPVYLKKEASMFTGKEPAAYRKKVLSYYQDVKSYGIAFLDELGGLRKEGPEKSKIETKTQTRAKARYITTQDLRDVPQNGTYQIHAGDVLTALAKDYIEKFGIRIMEE